MSLKLNTASGGSITLQEADTASNLTLTVPAQAGSIVAADSSGNVGIGTSSPSTKLHVNSGASTSAITLETTSTNTYTKLINSSGTSYIGAAGLNLVFEPNGTERMRIDASGRVTMPYQPAFRATTTTGGSYPTSGGNTINFNNVGSNIGGHFATSGGNAYKRFTAPVAGQYLFTASLMGNAGSGRYYFNLSKNGANFAQSGGSANDYGNFTIAVVVDMAVNDYTEVYLQSGTLYSASTSENYFSGYFLG
jgi:hypothetical protein